MLDNTPNHPSKLRTKNWTEIIDDSRETHDESNQIKFKTSLLKTSDYSNSYTLMSGTITVAELAADAGNKNIEVVFKNCTSFTSCISEINNTQIDNVEDIDIVMPVYNLMECSDNYSESSGSLWQYYRDKVVLTDVGTVDNFPGDSDSFKF